MAESDLRLNNQLNARFGRVWLIWTFLVYGSVYNGLSVTGAALAGSMLSMLCFESHPASDTTCTFTVDLLTAAASASKKEGCLRGLEEQLRECEGFCRKVP